MTTSMAAPLTGPMVDELTQVCGAELLADRLRHALYLDARLGTGVGVLYVDIDGLEIMDRLWGPGVSEEVLVEVVDRIRTGTRIGDTIGRVGDGEFVLVVEGVFDPDAVTTRLHNRLCEPIDLAGRLSCLTVSIGVIRADTTNPLSADELMDRARQAAARAAARGGNDIERAR